MRRLLVAWTFRALLERRAHHNTSLSLALSLALSLLSLSFGMKLNVMAAGLIALGLNVMAAR